MFAVYGKARTLWGGSSGGGGCFLFGALSVVGLATATLFSACYSVGWSLVSFTLCFPGLLVLYVYRDVYYFLISVRFIIYF